MNVVWGLIAAMGAFALGTEQHWSSTLALVVAFVAFSLVSGGLKSSWASSERRAHKKQIAEDELLRMAIRGERPQRVRRPKSTPEATRGSHPMTHWTGLLVAVASVGVPGALLVAGGIAQGKLGLILFGFGFLAVLAFVVLIFTRASASTAVAPVVRPPLDMPSAPTAIRSIGVCSSTTPSEVSIGGVER